MYNSTLGSREDKEEEERYFLIIDFYDVGERERSVLALVPHRCLHLGDKIRFDDKNILSQQVFMMNTQYVYLFDQFVPDDVLQ